MPFIRYQNGDMAIPGEGNDCRIHFKTLKSISGRVSDIIDLPGGGKLVVPSFFGSMLLKQVDGLLQYQIEKVANNEIIIKLVTSGDFKKKDKEKIELSLQEYLRDKIKWRIQLVDNIPLNKSGKFKLLVDKAKGRQHA
jgi:phenylacetate-CoA ligase